MKKVITLLAVAVVFASCGGGDTGNKKDELMSQLEAKKAELETIRKDIASLELELSKLDSNTTAAGKPVRIQPLALTTFEHSIDIQGRVDANESVSVGPQMPGLVKRVYVNAGDKVSAGQVLAEIDADAMTQQLSALKTQRDLAKQVYDRQKNLWDQKIGTEIQFMQTKAQYEALESQVNSVQEQIDMAKIKAPMAGVVDAVNIKAGELASPGFSNIVLVNTNNLRVKGEVAESYITKVKTGSAVNVYLPDAEKTINTKITYAGKMINNINRTFNVEVALAANEENVAPNMIAVLKISDYKNDSAIVAPLSIIQQNANGTNYVFVAVQKGANLVAEKRVVTYTWTYNGMAEITSGLQVGDQLISEGSNDLNEGDVVAPLK
jgi:membrane fusion protein, multidrug efflux system